MDYSLSIDHRSNHTFDFFNFKQIFYTMKNSSNFQPHKECRQSICVVCFIKGNAKINKSSCYINKTICARCFDENDNRFLSVFCNSCRNILQNSKNNQQLNAGVQFFYYNLLSKWFREMGFIRGSCRFLSVFHGV